MEPAETGIGKRGFAEMISVSEQPVRRWIEEFCPNHYVGHLLRFPRVFGEDGRLERPVPVPGDAYLYLAEGREELPRVGSVNISPSAAGAFALTSSMQALSFLVL